MKRIHGSILLLAAMLAACSGKQESQSAAEAPASLTVQLARPQRVHWQRQITANGAFAPWQEAIISAETGSLRIADIHVDVGTQVHKGQILATLARDSLLADRARMAASVAQAQANLGKARSDVERARQIGTSGALSTQQIETYRVTYQTAQASLDSARAQERSVQIQLGQTQVRAVDDGVVSSRSALLGKVVNAGDELFRLVRQNRVEWQAELGAQQITGVKAGQAARVTLPGGQQVAGYVRLVAPILNPGTSRGIAYVQLPRASPARPGMYGSGTIDIGDADVTVLPDTAVALRDGHAYVFVLAKGNHVKQQAVIAGQRRDGRIEVSGIAIDQDVVATSAAFLSDGATVRVERGDHR